MRGMTRSDAAIHGGCKCTSSNSAGNGSAPSNFSPLLLPASQKQVILSLSAVTLFKIHPPVADYFDNTAGAIALVRFV